MKINFTKTNANGIVEKTTITKQAGIPVKVVAEANTKLDVVIEADSKDKKVNLQKTTISRQGNNMLIKADGEVLAEVSDFYAVDGASLGGVEWNLAAPELAATAVTPEAIALESGAVVAEGGSLVGGAGMWGLVAGGVAIAVSGRGTTDPLSAIKSAANSNSATASTPALTDYQAAGITGVTSSNLAAINSILNDTDITSASVDTSAELQTLVNSYNTILAAADGTAGNGTAPIATDYSNVGINGINTATEVSLLGSVIDAKSSAAVDTSAELQALADAVQAVMTTAADGTSAVTKAQLELLGITGVTTNNIAEIVTAIVGTTDDGSGVSTLAALQTLANNVNDAPINTVPGALTVNEDTNLVITGLSVADADIATTDTLSVTLSVGHGTITVAAAPGVTQSGTPSALTLTGTLADINTALAASNAVLYRANSEYNGSDTLTVTSDDAGHTGTDGIKTDVDTVAITVTAIPDITSIVLSATGAQNNTLNAGDVVTATVSFDQSITVTGTPQLALNIGGTLVQANYASGSGTTALTFTYTVAAGNNDGNGISVDANALSLNSGTLKDTSGTNAIITHAAVADSSGFLVDTTAPAATTINTVATDDVINISEQGAVINGTNEAGATVALSIGGNTRAATVSGTTWSYTLTAADIMAMGQGPEALSVTQTDAAGNTSAAGTRDITVDTVAPTLTLSTVAGDNQVNAAEKTAGITISGNSNAEAGQVVTVDWAGTVKTFTLTNSGVWSVAYSSAEVPSDGNRTVNVSVSDVNGNPATATQSVAINTGSPTITLNTLTNGAGTPADADAILNANELSAIDAANKWTVSGTTTLISDGQSVMLTINGHAYSGTVTSNAWSIDVIDADVAALANGNEYAVAVSVSDTFGNPATASQTLKVLTSPSDIPTIIALNANTLTPTLTGSAQKETAIGSNVFVALDNNDQFTVTLNGQTYTYIVGGSSNPSALSYNASTKAWSLAVPAAVLTADGQYDVGVSVNAVGYATPKLDTSSNELVIKTAAPMVTINTIALDDYINATEHAASVVLSGTATDSNPVTSANTAIGRNVSITLNSHTYTAAVQLDGTWSVTVPAADVSALAEGTKTVSASYTGIYGGSDADSHDVFVDSIVPTITTAVVSGLDSADVAKTAVLNAGDKVQVVLTSSEAITGFTTSDKVSIQVGTTARDALWVSSSGNQHTFRYTLQAGDLDSTGGIALNSLTVAGVIDVATNALSLALPAQTNTLVVDGVAPAITSVSLTGATGAVASILNAGDMLTATVIFDDIVNVAGGIPTIGLTIGSTTIQAAYASGTGSNTLIFTYQVVDGQLDTTGVAIPVNSITLPAGVTIKDANNTSAILAHGLVTDNVSYKVDAIAPVFTSATTASVDENIAAGSTVYSSAVTDDNAIVYTLKPATGDVASFTINNSSGVVSINAIPNFEVKPSYTFTVMATDAGGTATERVVNLAINDLNEAPVITIGSGDSVASSIAESNAVLAASGTLTVNDPDPAQTVAASVESVTVGGTFAGVNPLTNAAIKALLSVSSAAIPADTADTHNLSWNFNSGAASAFDFLPDGQTLILTYTVKATDNGTTPLNDTETVVITITGSNDAAVISGTTTGAVTEAGGVANATAGTPTATGTLTSADVDGVTNAFTAVAAGTATTGGYGTYEMSAAGVWTYTLNDANATVQALAAAATLSDTFTVTAADGTSQVVTVTITGSNDAATISGTSTGAVTEAGGVANATAGTPTATGTLTSTDVDGTASSFTAVAAGTATTGGYGTYEMSAAGVWTYTLNNTNATVQALAAAATLSDTFTVTTADGTSQVVTVTITGSNDAAVISGTNTGAVTEAGGVANATAGTLTATGTLTSADVDGVTNAFTAVAAGTATTGGYGTYEMSAAGVWTYTLNDANATVQALAAAATLSDTFTVTAADGTSQVVTVTITGSNDAPTVTGGGTLAYVENGAATAIDAALTLVDPDSQISGATVTIGNANLVTGDTLGFTAQSGITGSYNSGTGVLTLTGTATAAQYQAALRSVTYSSTSDDPTVNATKLDRTVTWVVTDAQSLAATSVTSTINVTPVPDVTSVVLSATGANNSTLNVGDVVTATVTFDQAVTVTGTPRIALLIGATTVYADYTSVGSTTTALKFNYTIIAGQTDANGISVAANSLAQNLGSTIQGTVGTQNATLIHALVADNASYLVDTAAPVAPTINAVATDDTINSGEQTSVITGTNEAGATVALSIGGNTRAATVSGTTWSYTLTAADITAMGQGAETLSATQTDAAGNTSAPGTRAVTVDTTAPATPAFALTTDTGSSNSDGMSSNGSVTVSGVEAGGTWQYSTDGGTTWSASQPVTTNTFTLATNTYAVNAVQVRSYDAAGNVSAITKNIGSIVIDNTQPITPTLTLSSDTGTSSSDGITNNGTMTISGVEATATWQYSTNAGSTWSTAQPATTTTFTLAAGTYAPQSIIVRQTDLAGLTNITGGGLISVAENAATIVIDSTAPAASTFALTTDTGASNTDNISSNGAITVSGVEAGGTWQYSTDSGGTWSAAQAVGITSFTLVEGTYLANAVRVRSYDAAGNVSTVAQNAGTIIIDSTAPVVDLTSAAGLNYTVTSPLLDEVSGIYLQSGRSVTEVNDAIANVKVAVSGLEHGAYEKLVVGSQVINANGTGLPSSVSDGVNTWSVAYASGTFTFALNGGGYATTAQTERLIQSLSYRDVTLVQGVDKGIGGATWPSNFNITVTTDNATAPDGSSTADTIAINAGADSYAFKSYSGLTAGASYTFSFWAKLGTATNLGIANNQDATTSKLLTSTDGLSTSAWTQITQTYTASAGGVIGVVLGRWAGGAATTQATEPNGTVLVWGADLTAAKDNAINAWTSNANLTATPNNVTAPDGTLTADTFQLNTGADSYAFKSYSGLTANTNYTFSVWVELGTATNLGIDVSGGATTRRLLTTADGLSTTTWTQVQQTYTSSATGTIGVVLGRWGANPLTTQVTEPNGTIKLWGAKLALAQDNAINAWTAGTNNTLVADNQVAPDGTTTADTLSLQTGADSYAYKTFSGLTAGGSYNFSVWVKLGTATNFGVANNQIAGSGALLTSADGLSNTTWTQINQTYTASAAGVIGMVLGRWSANAATTQVTEPNGSVYLWGAQLVATRDKAENSTGDRTFTLTATDASGNTSGIAIATVKQTAATPLVLDLNGDGIHTAGLLKGVVFDVASDGALKRTGWVDSHDGLLALDLNHNGKIDNGAELFGSGTTLADGSKAKDGYAALRQYDANSDGVMDAKDAVFDNLKVWVDADTDGITDAGELKGLTDLGIASINLNALNALGSENGNSVILQSSWTDTNGVAHSLADWVFATDGRQVLVAPDGASTLTGSTGGDVFRLAQGSTGTLTVTDFKASQNDALDLSALLKGAGLTANSTDTDLSRYLQLTQSGNDAVFKVDTTGNSNFVAPAETIVFTNGSLNGMNDTLHHLVANGQVILG